MGVKLLATGLIGRLMVTDQLNFIWKHCLKLRCLWYPTNSRHRWDIPDLVTKSTSNYDALKPSFHHLVVVLPLPLEKFWKNYVSTVRITLYMWKIPLHHCRDSCRFTVTTVPHSRSKWDRILFLPFCRSWTANQCSGYFIPTDTESRFQHFSYRAHCATAMVPMEWKNGNGTTERSLVSACTQWPKPVSIQS